VARIRKLAIPPAYTDVWISPDRRGHLQATGRDARGRKQYRYHPRWREVRDETKFDRMVAFAKALDFRTWEGTLACTLALASERCETKPLRKARVVAAIKAVSERLGNTPAVCKKSYIHPGVIDEFLANGGLDLVGRKAGKARSSGPPALSADESRVLAFIETLGAREDNKQLGEFLVQSLRRRGANTAANEPDLRTARKTGPRRSR
jgi:DNA topoisomerase IB